MTHKQVCLRSYQHHTHCVCTGIRILRIQHIKNERSHCPLTSGTREPMKSCKEKKERKLKDWSFLRRCQAVGDKVPFQHFLLISKEQVRLVLPLLLLEYFLSSREKKTGRCVLSMNLLSEPTLGVQSTVLGQLLSCRFDKACPTLSIFKRLLRK